MIRETLWLSRTVAESCRRHVAVMPRHLAAWQRFWRSYRAYSRLAPPDRRPVLENLYPCPGEDTEEISVEPLYYFQDAWAFEKIVQSRPMQHVDVGSHHKFVALLSRILPVISVDIRRLPLQLSGLEFRFGSILQLPFPDASTASLSSLCVVEHIGLGRYGDPLDPYGTEKAIEELKRITRPGGDLYVSLPLDDENRIYFNAHRAFTEAYALRMFTPFSVLERRYIYGCDFGDSRRAGFGTGCYHLRRPI